MNIFFLDENPKTAVQMLCDCHIVKMTLETAQLLCTRRRIDCNEGMKTPFQNLYRGTHQFHPCQVCLSRKSNLEWLKFYFSEILGEYKRRFGKEHKCKMFVELFRPEGDTPPRLSEVDFPKCMPEEFKTESVVDSYRNYYSCKAKILHKFNFRNPFKWQLEWRDSLLERR